ncbi:hypothetical protein GCM10009540_32390 [Streptomyces turgidiscabies]
MTGAEAAAAVPGFVLVFVAGFVPGVAVEAVFAVFRMLSMFHTLALLADSFGPQSRSRR